jgi:hypothetical protein
MGPAFVAQDTPIHIDPATHYIVIILLQSKVPLLVASALGLFYYCTLEQVGKAIIIL